MTVIRGARPRGINRAAWAAALIAAVSAAISIYWTFGGTVGIRTVGGSIARMAVSGTSGAIVLALFAALLKLAGVLFALILAGTIGRRLPARPLVFLGWAAAAVLVAYGAANMVGATLSLTGAVRAPEADRYALAWHLGLWDLLFLVWGACLGMAVRWFGRDRRAIRGS